jgi:hypothetical protein
VVTIVAAVAIASSGCGGEPSLSEYAEEVERLIVVMNSGLDVLDESVAGRSPSLEEIRTYAVGRVDLRNEFLEDFRTIEPPERLDEFHDAALDVMERLTEAETRLADQALALDAPAEAARLWETEAGLAAREVDEEAVAICKAAQAEFNATEDNAIAEGVPWIPAEMKEVVRVAFYCDRSERP